MPPRRRIGKGRPAAKNLFQKNPQATRVRRPPGHPPRRMRCGPPRRLSRANRQRRMRSRLCARSPKTPACRRMPPRRWIGKGWPAAKNLFRRNPQATKCRPLGHPPRRMRCGPPRRLHRAHRRRRMRSRLCARSPKMPACRWMPPRRRIGKGRPAARNLFRRNPQATRVRHPPGYPLRRMRCGPPRRLSRAHRQRRMRSRLYARSPKAPARRRMPLPRWIGKGWFTARNLSSPIVQAALNQRRRMLRPYRRKKPRARLLRTLAKRLRIRNP